MHRMYAVFSDKAYEDMVNGEAKSNNGFRKNDGSFYPDQPDFVEIEDEEDADNHVEGDASAQIIAVAIGAGIAIGAVVAPYVKRLWNEAIVPGVKNIFSMITGKKSADTDIEKSVESHATSLSVLERTGMSAKMFSKEIDVAFENFGKNMSSEEAQMHILNIMKLAELLASEIRSLSGAVIVDYECSGEYLEWKVALEKLTTQQVTDSINYMLENNGELFQGGQLQELSWIWGCNEMKEGVLLPVENEQIKKALSI